MNNVVQYTEKYRKNIALDMRKEGFSYSDIQKKLHIPKSTLSYWFRYVKLSKEQVEELDEKRSTTARANIEKRKLRMSRGIEALERSSAGAIRTISKRELWLMGTVLYWRERFLRGNENDIRKGVRFTSSDSYLIRLFLKWLFDIGRLQKEDIAFDIFIEEGKLQGAVQYWSKITGFPTSVFSRIYFLKPRKIQKRLFKKPYFGLLRIRVKASSLLARQIAGWIEGIQNYFWKELELG